MYYDRKRMCPLGLDNRKNKTAERRDTARRPKPNNDNQKET